MVSLLITSNLDETDLLLRVQIRVVTKRILGLIESPMMLSGILLNVSPTAKHDSFARTRSSSFYRL